MQAECIVTQVRRSLDVLRVSPRRAADGSRSVEYLHAARQPMPDAH